MKAESYWSEAERMEIMTILVHAQDLSNSVNSREIIRDVRASIAQKITERIMAKLGPILDKALGEYTP